MKFTRNKCFILLSLIFSVLGVICIGEIIASPGLAVALLMGVADDPSIQPYSLTAILFYIVGCLLILYPLVYFMSLVFSIQAFKKEIYSRATLISVIPVMNLLLVVGAFAAGEFV